MAVASGERAAQEGPVRYEAAAKAWPSAVEAAQEAKIRAEIAEQLLAAQKAEAEKAWIEAKAAAERVLVLKPGHAEAGALVKRISKNWRPESATKDRPWENSLGMKFVPVPGTRVLFSIWDLRVRDYAAYATAATGVDGKWRNPGFPQNDVHPVVYVSWDEAKAFCEWLTRKGWGDGELGQGQRYRLLTDSEWCWKPGFHRLNVY